MDGTFSTTSADWWKSQNNFFSTTSADAWDTSKWRWATTSSDYWLTTKSFSSFSTTSADYWETTKWRWATTSSDHWLTLNQALAFSTTSASYFLSQNQSLGFGTSSSDYWLSQHGKGFFFSTTSADAWDATKARWSTTSSQYFERTLWRWATSFANYFESTQTRWATTSSDYWLTQNCGQAFSTTSADAFLGTKSSDDITQGSANKYYATALFATDLAATTTDALRSGGAVSIPAASGGTNGYLSSADWNAFNTKFATTSSDYWISQFGKGFFFSTTSANTWDAAQFRWSTTSTDYWKTANNFFSTTSTDAWDAMKNRWATTSATYFESTQWRWSTSSSNYWETTQTRWATTSSAYFLSQNQGAAFSTQHQLPHQRVNHHPAHHSLERLERPAVIHAGFPLECLFNNHERAIHRKRRREHHRADGDGQLFLSGQWYLEQQWQRRHWDDEPYIHARFVQRRKQHRRPDRNYTNPNSGSAAGALLSLKTDGGQSFLYRTSNAYGSGVADDTVLQDLGGGDIVMYGASEIARFTNSGNVGIGNTNPSYKLDVNGFVNVDATAGGYKQGGTTIFTPPRPRISCSWGTRDRTTSATVQTTCALLR